MNSFLLKKVGLYGVGAVLGGGVGYLVTDHVLTLLEYREFNKIVDELDKQQATGIIEKEEYKEKEVKSEWTPEAAKSLPRKPRKKSADAPPVDYTKFVAKRSPEEEVRARIKEEAANVDPNQPYVIDLETHSADTPHHEKRVWTYYEDDGEVADENETLITAPEDFIGNALQHFGEDSGDIDTVYVRNIKLATDYEIVRLHTSYSKKVLGQELIDKKDLKNKKHNTRKVNKLDKDEEEDA